MAIISVALFLGLVVLPLTGVGIAVLSPILDRK